MTRLDLEIMLLDDVVLPRESGSVGGAGTLDTIPGAALLGAAAGALYKADPGAALKILHHGGVRFGDGLPIGPDEQPGLPAPRSLMHAKGARPGHGSVHNKARRATGTESETATEALRRGRVADERYWEVDTATTMRTAIGPDGRAHEGLLYGYEALSAGQRFRASLRAEDPALLAAAWAALQAQDGVIRVGRSRSAEFGRAQLREIPPLDPPVLAAPAELGRVVVLCVTDLCLYDAETGQPTFEPAGAAFGLSGWRLDPNRSAIQTRRYSPYNAHRRRHDLERQVIAAGSVLVFEGKETVDLAAARVVCAVGVGEHTGAGLGEVLLEPRLLSLSRLDLKPWEPSIPGADWSLLDGDPLRAWLESRAADSARRDNLWNMAGAWAGERAWTRLNKAQWGLVRELAQRAVGRGDDGPRWLRDELAKNLLPGAAPKVGEARRGAGVRVLSSGWGARPPGGRTLGEVFLARIDDVIKGEAVGLKPADLPVFCELFATRALRARALDAGGSR